MSDAAMPDQGHEELVADFTVRIWRHDSDRVRVEVIGNRSGRTASEHTGYGIQWVFGLLRALKRLGAFSLARQSGQ